MATEKKQSFLGGAAVLAFGIMAVKVIGAVFKIPLRNILGEGGSADFSNAYNIYATMLTISTAGLPVALSKLVSEAYARGRTRQALSDRFSGAGARLVLADVVGQRLSCLPSQ